MLKTFRPSSMRVPIVLLALTLLAVPAPTVSAQGTLVIIGGGDRPASVMETIVERAGGPNGRIVVFPQASAIPDTVGVMQRDELLRLGIGSAAVALGDPSADSTLALLEGATGVFFSGGDQRRLAEVLHGSPALDRIRSIYARGGVISGTSAGAAVMSEVMITGDERRPGPGEPFSSVELDQVVTDRGFGFIDFAIVDQHFVERKRQNRLLSLVLEHPHLLGIGIDEETAIVVEASGEFAVVGNRGVQVFDARAACVEATTLLSARGVVLHHLAPGDRFDPHEAPQQITCARSD